MALTLGVAIYTAVAVAIGYMAGVNAERRRRERTLFARRMRSMK